MGKIYAVAGFHGGSPAFAGKEVDDAELPGDRWLVRSPEEAVPLTWEEAKVVLSIAGEGRSAEIIPYRKVQEFYDLWEMEEMVACHTS